MEQDSTLLDVFLWLAYIMTAIAVVAAIILPLIKSLDHPQSLLKVGVGLVALLVIFGISYALSSSELMPVAVREEITGQGLKLIGATIITMYILTIIAVLSIAVTEVTKYFR